MKKQIRTAAKQVSHFTFFGFLGINGFSSPISARILTTSFRTAERIRTEISTPCISAALATASFSAGDTRILKNSVLPLGK
jgi:hypothetical protein